MNSNKADKQTKMYMVLNGATGFAASQKLYTYRKARKLVSRAKRFGMDVYMSSPAYYTIKQMEWHYSL